MRNNRLPVDVVHIAYNPSPPTDFLRCYYLCLGAALYDGSSNSLLPNGVRLDQGELVINISRISIAYSYFHCIFVSLYYTQEKIDYCWATRLFSYIIFLHLTFYYTFHIHIYYDRDLPMFLIIIAR